MRTFRVIKKDPVLRNEYISEEDYYLVAISDNEVVYKKMVGHGSSFMRPSKFKEALREKAIVFTD